MYFQSIRLAGYHENVTALYGTAIQLSTRPNAHPLYHLRLYPLSIERSALVSQADAAETHAKETIEIAYEEERERIEDEWQKGREKIRERMLEGIEERRRKAREEKDGEGTGAGSFCSSTSCLCLLLTLPFGLKMLLSTHRPDLT
jgi:hypothetical protein